MLTHLNLINFALADRLAMDIDQGFNVLTGETRQVNLYCSMPFQHA